MLAVSKYSNLLVFPPKKELINKSKEEGGISGEAKCSSLASTRPTIQKGREKKPAPEHNYLHHSTVQGTKSIFSSKRGRQRAAALSGPMSPTMSHVSP